MEDKKEMQFTWKYCSTCQGYMIICPKCGNNCCNGGYGNLLNGKPIPIGNYKDKDVETCDVCPLAYQYQELGYKHEDHPIPTKEQLLEPNDVDKLFGNSE